MKYVLLLICLLSGLARAAEVPKIEFRSGDRIALIGNDFFEREQENGYIETQLTSRFPEMKLTFRNLGYAGDTVWADARSLCSGWDQFGPPDQGFQRLAKLVGEFKPTLVFVAYGMNESFDGRAGLDHFQQGLNRMLDMLAKTGARIVLISPIAHERKEGLPDPAAHAVNLNLYTGAMRDAAAARGMGFIDLQDKFTDLPPIGGYTFDGIHLNPEGYRLVARAIEQSMGYPRRAWNIVIDGATGRCETGGIAAKEVSVHTTGIRFVATAAWLPEPPRGQQFAAPGRVLKVTGMAPGQYMLTVDGKQNATGSDQQWAQGAPILKSTPDDEQAESLRKLIVEKNFDYFNYWRPQNDTYIFGYRNHEQGRNAVEMPHFLKLLEDKEAQVAALSAPASHAYVLTAVRAK